MREISLLDGQVRGVILGQGPQRLLAFHGFLDNAYSFRRLSDALPDVELWCLDLPGHGLSSALPEQEGTFILQWLPVLGRALDELNWPSYQILGHSLGAILSQMLAALDPRITSLLSLDGLGPLTASTAQNLDRFQKLYNARGKRFPIRYYDSYDALIASREKGMFPLSRSAAETMAGRAVGLSEHGWFHRYNRRLRDESLWRLSEEEVLGWLARIGCPVNLLLFDTHRWAPMRDVFEARQRAVPELNLHQMNGSHHNHLEQPDEVAVWVRQCLE
ncbi:alpha/beta fold hydrolase [Reinekea blandensis]|uniref:Hydrolase, alpha/beta fold family protein n=1 Tax=Reinekea blandensis MED297 TaxID=314283 RepID=A4BEJ7_9GAMM|nr:alpha/beta hydrolase [Reinekea blandensis]EAR09424.1 hydrolase, alpha/beta fold family protein [Reinekea sp. MED297] [Reinekea blandensis MED297]